MYKNNIFFKKTQKTPKKSQKRGKSRFFKQPPTRPQRSVGIVFTTPDTTLCPVATFLLSLIKYSMYASRHPWAGFMHMCEKATPPPYVCEKRRYVPPPPTNLLTRHPHVLTLCVPVLLPQGSDISWGNIVMHLIDVLRLRGHCGSRGVYLLVPFKSFRALIRAAVRKLVFQINLMHAGVTTFVDSCMFLVPA